MADPEFADLLTDGKVNAVLAWILCTLFAVSAIEGLVTGDYLWAGFALFVGFTVSLPAIAARNLRRLPPWEMVLLAGLPVVGRAVATVEITSTVATYLSFAALALLVAVNLHLFTSVEMSLGFAVVFVAVTTLAAAGIWAVLRWISDLYLGTELLLDPDLTRDEIEEHLMWEFVGATVAGLVAGVVFEEYIRRRARVGARLPGGESA